MRNCIERIFGVLKKRFPVLREPLAMSLASQADIVPVLCWIHNFIRRENPLDIPALEDARQNGSVSAPEGEEEEEEDTPQQTEDSGESEFTTQRRDKIAQAMWKQYQTELESRVDEMQ